MENIFSDLSGKGYSIVKVNTAFAGKLKEVFNEGRKFFDRPDDEKFSCSNEKALEGYRRLGAEYSLTEDRRDLCETFSVWAGDLQRQVSDEWKKDSKYYKALIDIFSEYNKLVSGIFEEIRKNLKPDAPILNFETDSYLQMNYYQPVKHTRDFLQDEHEDGHLLTVVTATAKGIEIKTGGEYIAPEIGPDELMIMPGLILSLLTGNKIKALYHRVRNVPNTDTRISLMYFVNPNLDQTVHTWTDEGDVDIIGETIKRSKAFGLDPIDRARAGTV
jgi:isopenicillin N synthase-like dioxygenase